MKTKRATKRPNADTRKEQLLGYFSIEANRLIALMIHAGERREDDAVRFPVPSR